jgi:hypothetical protein
MGVLESAQRTRYESRLPLDAPDHVTAGRRRLARQIYHEEPRSTVEITNKHAN